MSDGSLRDFMWNQIQAMGAQEAAAARSKQYLGQAAQQGYVREVRTEYVDRIVTKYIRPEVEDLARAMFDTDPDVRKFCLSVDDAMPPKGAHGDGTFYNSDEAGRRWRRAFEIAWQRDELGARTVYMRRAREILDGEWLRRDPAQRQRQGSDE